MSVGVWRVRPLKEVAKMERVLLTVPEACRALAIERSKLYELLMRGELRSVSIGRARRIPASAIHEFIEKLAGEES